MLYFCHLQFSKTSFSGRVGIVIACPGYEPDSDQAADKTATDTAFQFTVGNLLKEGNKFKLNLLYLIRKLNKHQQLPI